MERWPRRAPKSSGGKQRMERALNGHCPLTFPPSICSLVPSPLFKTDRRAVANLAAQQSALQPSFPSLNRPTQILTGGFFSVSWPPSLALGPSREERRTFSRFLPTLGPTYSNPLTCSPVPHFWKPRQVEQLLLPQPQPRCHYSHHSHCHCPLCLPPESRLLSSLSSPGKWLPLARFCSPTW